VEPVKVSSPWTNGRAEVRVRSLKEMVGVTNAEAVRETGMTISVQRCLTSWVIRHCEWIINCMRPCAAGPHGAWVTPHEASTDRSPNWKCFLKRILYKCRIEGRDRYEVEWYVGTRNSGDLL
jgi:hypothetical protein